MTPHLQKIRQTSCPGSAFPSRKSVAAFFPAQWDTNAVTLSSCTTDRGDIKGLLQVRHACGTIQTMVAVNEIKSFCRQIAIEYRPSQIVLFGSYARGKARPDSDVDLLVVMSFKGNGVSKAAEMIRRLSPSFAVDLVIRTPADIKRRLAMNDFFLKEAVQGKLLYEAPDR